MDPEPHPSPSHQVPYLFSSGRTFSLDLFLSCMPLWNTFLCFILLDRFNSIWMRLWKLHPFMFRQHFCILSRILVPSFTFCRFPFHVSVCPGAPYSPMMTTYNFLLDFLIDMVDCSWAWVWLLNINQSFGSLFPTCSFSVDLSQADLKVTKAWSPALQKCDLVVLPCSLTTGCWTLGSYRHCNKPTFSLTMSSSLFVRIRRLWVNPAKMFSPTQPHSRSLQWECGRELEVWKWENSCVEIKTVW